jgi:hypothetical protein
VHDNEHGLGHDFFQFCKHQWKWRSTCGWKHTRVSQFWQIRNSFQNSFLVWLKIGLKYEY